MLSVKPLLNLIWSLEVESRCIRMKVIILRDTVLICGDDFIEGDKRSRTMASGIDENLPSVTPVCTWNLIKSVRLANIEERASERGKRRRKATPSVGMLLNCTSESHKKEPGTENVTVLQVNH